jgi:molybdenum cofactor guanylyltransferase
VIASVILAGGEASRLGGRAKGLEVIGGKTIMERVASVLPSDDSPSFMSLSARNQDLVLPPQFAGRERIIDNGEGPAVALARILERVFKDATVTHLVTAPWDCPFLPENLVIQLYDKSMVGQTSMIAASAGRGHPVVALWRREETRPLQSLIQQGERKLQALVRTVNAAVEIWPDQPFDPFFNVNTAEDLTLAKAFADRRMLDLSGLKCPLPVLRSRKAMRSIAPGAMLDVIATDAMSAIDIPHFVREDGHKLIGQLRMENAIRFLIQRASSQSNEGLG